MQGEKTAGPGSHQAYGELGALLLDAGASVTDAGETLNRVAAARGESLSFSVLPAAVLVSARGGGVATIVTVGEELTLRQAARASLLAQRVHSGEVGVEEVPDRVRALREGDSPVRVGVHAFGSALTAAGLAVLFRCPWWAVALALVLGAVAGLLLHLARAVKESAAILPFVLAFGSTLAVAAVSAAFDFGSVPLFAVCAPVAILVPGTTITNALLELSATDMVTGAARLMYGLLVLALMTIGIAAASTVAGLHVDPDSVSLLGDASSATGVHGGWQALPPTWVSWPALVALAVGIAFALGADRRLAGVFVVMMTLTYAGLIALTPVLDNAAAVGVVAGVVFLLARVAERLPSGIPAGVVFQPAFLILVPGTVGLVALNTLDDAAVTAALATFLSLAIGTKFGAVVADLVTAPSWLGR